MKITFTGDIMCKKEFFDIYRTNNGQLDFFVAFKEIKPLLEESDVVISNLETPLAGEECGGYTYQEFCFNSPTSFGKAVKDSGVTYVSTANNHCLDRGIEGLILTNKNLDSIGLLHSGTNNEPNSKKGTLIDCHGVKIGILSYTYGTEAASNNVYLTPEQLFYVNLSQEQELHNSVLRKLYKSKFFFIRCIYKMHSILTGQRNLGKPSDRKEKDSRCKKELKKEINNLKDNGADYIVVNFHAGGQYNRKPEKRVIKYVKWLHNNGANFVIVNHEHLVQVADFSDIEKGHVTTYCLGNFLGGAGVYYPPFNKKADYSVLLHLYIDNKEIKPFFSITKTVQEHEGDKIIIKSLFDLINNTQDEDKKAQLCNDNLSIYNTFLNKKEIHIPILKEYPCI